MKHEIHITKTELLTRGWSEKLIHEFYFRPAFRDGSKKYFAESRIREIEATDEFQEAFAKLCANRAKHVRPSRPTKNKIAVSWRWHR